MGKYLDRFFGGFIFFVCINAMTKTPPVDWTPEFTILMALPFSVLFGVLFGLCFHIMRIAATTDEEPQHGNCGIFDTFENGGD